MNNEAVQRLTILVMIIVIWELYARWLNNGLLFPSFSETIKTFSKDIANGVLIDRTIHVACARLRLVMHWASLWRLYSPPSRWQALPAPAFFPR